MITSAHTIANEFIRLAENNGKTVTNIQLQQLVFIAHGCMLGLHDRPLYYHDTYAWLWGPVIKELYEPLRKYGRGEVTCELETSAAERLPAESEEMKVVEAVWMGYGTLSGGQLCTITQKPGGAWSVVWERDPFGVIPQQRIADHYKQAMAEAQTAQTAKAA